MNEVNMSEVRNSESKFDENGFLYLYYDDRIKKHEYKLFAPTNSITITKNLGIIINPKSIYRDNLSSNRKIIPPNGSSIELELAPGITYRLKHQHRMVDMVKSFENFDDLKKGDKYFIKQTGSNSIAAIETRDENMLAAGPNNATKLKVLFNTAMHHEEFELAGIVYKTIRNMLSSSYTVGVPKNKNYVALLTK